MTQRQRIERDAKILEMFNAGTHPVKIGEHFELSKKMIYNILAAHGIVFSNKQRRQYRQ